MKRCSQCNREILDSATTCGHCDSLGAADLALETVPPVVQTTSTAVAPVHVASPVEGAGLAQSAVPTPVADSVPAAVPVHAAATEPAAAAAAVPVAVAAASKAGSAGNRRMLLAGLLVIAGGTLTFAMFRSSATPATPLSWSPAASKPAASKPNAPKPAAANATTASTAVTTASTPIVSKWTAANREWLLNVKKGAAFELKSDNKVAIWQAIAQPVLVVRCDAGKLQAFIYTASAIQMEAQDENHSVGISFDGEPEVPERWADSDDHDALFAPDGAAFAHRLATAQTLRFSYKPHNAPRGAATFQVAGLTETLHPVAKQCGWK